MGIQPYYPLCSMGEYPFTGRRNAQNLLHQHFLTGLQAHGGDRLPSEAGAARVSPASLPASRVSQVEDIEENDAVVQDGCELRQLNARHNIDPQASNYMIQIQPS